MPKKRKKSLKSKDNMVWIDLEMTGLEPEKDTIVEIATIVTDGDLNILETGPSIAIRHPEKVIKNMEPWSRRTHTKSGLIKNMRESKVGMRKAEELTLKFLRKYCYHRTAPLCGNSVHHDRRFIIKHMKKLDRFLHYRLVDVTCLKGLVQRWYTNDRKRPKKSNNHRALEDVIESIEELRYYRKKYFKNLR